MNKKTLKPKKCKAPSCLKEFIPFSSLAKACCVKCALELNKVAADKKYNQETKRLKESIKTRTEWYDGLQVLVNRYVRLRDKDKPCCTCGKTSDVKYDAGHFLSRGAFPELRFELTNIHKQCSVNCNQHGSGMRKEYEDFIAETYGDKHLRWLKGPHELLKDKYPHTDDIKEEIKKFREMIKEIKRG
tara:strand:- start:293 stop:853 length:561 start_codon:yes stop_codon:yes gene_type:complete